MKSQRLGRLWRTRCDPAHIHWGSDLTVQTASDILTPGRSQCWPQVGETVPKVKYVFCRNDKSRRGSQSTNQPSTDATSALEYWRGEAVGRSCEKVTEDDASLTAQLSWSDDDTKAGSDLDTMCDRFGVERKAFASRRISALHER